MILNHHRFLKYFEEKYLKYYIFLAWVSLVEKIKFREEFLDELNFLLYRSVFLRMLFVFRSKLFAIRSDVWFALGRPRNAHTESLLYLEIWIKRAFSALINDEKKCHLF